MEQPAVSVVIPVYNGETHLRQCLDSVRTQTLENIEIICVDDFSADSSWRILEEYQAEDPRFRLVRHAENQGVSAARNSGLSIAQGDYVIFWDCDDFFEPDALELLEGKARHTNADVCVCGADRYFQDREKLLPFPGYLNLKLVPEGAETFNRLTNEKYILNFTTIAVMNKLFRRAFLREHGLSWPPYRFGEDVFFNISALCLADRIATVDRVLAHYRVNNPKSLVGQFGTEPFDFTPRLAVAEHLRSLGALPEDSFGWSSIADVIYMLRMAKTKEVFLSAVHSLHEDGVLEKLCITEREPEYYRNARQEQYVKHLIHDAPEDFLTFLMHDTYMELREVTGSRNDFRSSRDRLKKQLASDRKAHESELSRLSEENQQLQQAQETLSEEKRQWQAEANRLSRDNRKLQTKATNLTADKRQLQAEVNSLSQQRQQLHAEVGKLSRDRQQWQTQAENLSQDKRRLQTEIKHLTRQTQRHQADIQSLTERNQQLTARSETLSANLHQTRRQLQSTQQTLDDLRNSLSFRLGEALLYLPRKIASLFRQKKP